MVNIFQRYILVFLSKAKRALFKPFQLCVLSLSLSLSLSLNARRFPAPSSRAAAVILTKTETRWEVKL